MNPDYNNQSYILHEYNKKYREEFNDELFYRDNNAIEEELEKVILSCQRDHNFKFIVESFEVIESYREVQERLKLYYDDLYKSKKKKRDNPYDYIDLKDSDIKLLSIQYYIEAKGEGEHLNVLIAIPRIVNKYYFRISGNMYIAQMQVVDGSTYNNSTSSNAKKASITLKNIFMPIRINRSEWELEDINGELVKTTVYYSRIFNKSFNCFKYILAKYGLYGTLNFFNIYHVLLSTSPTTDSSYYCFKRFADVEIYVSVPKYIFDNNEVVQSLVHALWISTPSKSMGKFVDMFTPVFWVWSLSTEFGSGIIEKGYSILVSLEGIYDKKTRELLRLPDPYKVDVYDVLKWMMCEFDNLKAKDNLDVGIKRIRIAEYIASLYAAKLATSIYRISDNSSRLDLDKIRKVVVIDPLYLMRAITKCNLVNYRDLVNDLDAIIALKYTYKGISGIGESSKTVPAVYRNAHYSQLGFMDLDSSSKSDPGMSGMLCPLSNVHNGAFSSYIEPYTWPEAYQHTIEEYDKQSNKNTIVTFRNDIVNFKKE